ncbi:regulatory protein RecX [Massilibacteroides vaginae]|jgi:regulatory protein|uniref:regulatory protein RecX n=1 Tax=Massilibacteroides vaginae TaxID=1673718 RepID=UPI000A1CCF15|nr:regulatory protein RecX [Massilibacteroides vaginae]
MSNTTETTILQRMAALCSVKEYCIRDIRQKIKATDLTDEACERIIHRLCSEKFIDEERYTRAFVKDKLRFSKWGRVKIKYELRGKEVPSSLIENILNEIDETAYKTMLKEILIQKKKSTKGKTAQEVFVKLYRFAAGRGFESPFISACLKEILNTDTDEADFD